MYRVHEEQQRLAEAARHVLSERGPMTADDLATALADRGHACGDGSEALEDLLIEEGTVVDLPDGRLVLLASVCERFTLTHRLTGEEAGDGIVAIEPDLAPLLIAEKESFRTAHGEARVLYPREGDPAVDEDHRLWDACALVGPPGWLSGARAGDLVVFRWDSGNGGLLSVAREAGPLNDAAGPAATLAEVFARYGEEGCPIEASLLLTATLADVPDLLNAPLPPLSEIYALAGLEGRAEWVGAVGQDWDYLESPWLDPRISEALGLDEVGAEALGVVFGAYQLLSREGPEGFRHLAEEEGALPALALMLSVPGVADLFLTSVLGEDPDEEPLVAAFAEAILAGGQAPGPHYLLACCAEHRNDVAIGEAHLREALAIDPEFVPALIDAAWYASDRGDAKSAVTYLHRVELPTGYAFLAQLEHFAAPGPAAAGRNDRCPCGSGRKYKVCCVQRNGHPLHERATWLHQKGFRFLMRVPQRNAVLDVAAARAGGDADEETWAHVALDDGLVQDLALFDREVFTTFLDVRGALLPADELELGRTWVGIRRSLYEVTGVRHGVGLTLRDLRAGDVLEVSDSRTSLEARPGDLLYARVAPDGRSHLLLGGTTEIPPEQRDRLIAFLDTDPSAEEAAAWLTDAESRANGQAFSRIREEAWP